MKFVPLSKVKTLNVLLAENLFQSEKLMTAFALPLDGRD